MTGGENITIDVQVYCPSCMDDKLWQLMKLSHDVERGEAEYRCPQCQKAVVVSVQVGN